ncbi:unnamed protein product [Psylliodes chrysocephalus]|uniref:Uncharacterized protein n=1 Tax=Psylliodes chrysocephalus TaxID=3402493 RepID=A0A9P0D0X7_9CUCU|nr:unnamed protein product [Psylliodes chrysocephala]
MQSLLIIAPFFVLTAYADLATEHTKLKKIQTECETKLGEPKNLFIKMIEDEYIGETQKAGKMALCIITGMGILNQDGVLIADNFKVHVERLVEDEDKRKTIIDTCGQIKGSGPEENALNFVKCMEDNVPRAIAKEFLK